jgi:hypothetical protein
MGIEHPLDVVGVGGSWEGEHGVVCVSVWRNRIHATRNRNPRVVRFVPPVCFDRALLFIGFHRRLSRH